MASNLQALKHLPQSLHSSLFKINVSLISKAFFLQILVQALHNLQFFSLIFFL